MGEVGGLIIQVYCEDFIFKQTADTLQHSEQKQNWQQKNSSF